MQLISTIINELTNVDISLTSPLMKTKVLASRIKNEELLNWVNNELEGYSDLTTIPNYRQTKGEIAGDYMNGNWKATNQILNFPAQDEEVKNNLYGMRLAQSVQVLESYNPSGNSIVAELITGDQRNVLEQYLIKSNPYLNLQRIYRRVPSNFILEILSIVRNRLLDFMLEIEAEYDTLTDIKELKNYNEAITQIMNTTINNSGDGVNIINGNGNSIKSSVNITKGNKEYLIKELLRAKVTQEEIDDLLQVIDNGLPNSKSVFNSEVKGWISKMINKAIDGSWNIGIGAAGNMLSTAIQNYYGIH